MKNLEEYCKKHKKVYFIDTDEVIYKYIFNRHNFVKLTHWTMGEDRRVSFEDLNNKELKELTRTKANELTNKYWNNLTREWKYKGKKYKALSIKDKQLYYPDINPKAHIFPCDNKYIKEYKFWVGLYQNRIIWYTIFPEGCVILKFYNIDKEPTISSDWIGYVSENGIQPILDCETNEFI